MAGLYGISATVFVEKGGEILILKRGLGEAKGSWYMPGGGIEEGETTEDCARRELREETGLSIDGPMHLIALTPMHAYDHDLFAAAYACSYTGGNVELSHEHTDFRWVNPVEYRERYFSDKALKIAEERSAGAAKLARSVQAELDAYIAYKGL